MATYAFANRGAAVPYESPFHAGVLRRKVDTPALIADPSKLALASAPTAPLTSFTKFASSDVLEVFEVPDGFLLTNVIVSVGTAEGGTATADIGNASATQTHLLTADADGYMGTLDLNSATVQMALVGDAQLGVDNNMGVLFVTDGSIDITFNNDVDAAIFDVIAVGWHCGAV